MKLVFVYLGDSFLSRSLMVGHLFRAFGKFEGFLLFIFFDVPFLKIKKKD